MPIMSTDKHTFLLEPPDDAVLWRFMDFTKYVDMLSTSTLYFSQARKLEDRYEGALTVPTIEQFKTKFFDLKGKTAAEVEKLLKEMKEWHDQAREMAFLSCWHLNAYESAAMWKLYLKTDEGVALRTTYRRLRDALWGCREELFPTRVRYIDYAADTIPWGNLFYFFMHKRKSFEHENEVRLMHLFGSPDAAPPGVRVSVSIPDLIERVIVSPTSQAWFRDLVESVTRKYDVDCSIEKSKLYEEAAW